jgi:hypothetical protein
LALMPSIILIRDMRCCRGRSCQLRSCKKQVTCGSMNGKFVSLRDGVSEDKRKLFALIHRYNPLFKQLFGGIRLPWSDKAPYAHHNQIQLAIKEPGFKGYSELAKMRHSEVGHIDQPDGRKRPEGRNLCNYTALLGIVLSGATADRDDAGNLWLAPASHRKFAAKFKSLDHVPKYYPRIVTHYFQKKQRPKMKVVRAEPC